MLYSSPWCRTAAGIPQGTSQNGKEMTEMYSPYRISICARTLASAALLLGAASVCSAGSVTYSVSLSIGSGSVTGFIETDGTIGPVNTINLLNWNLLLTDSAGSFDLLGPLSGSNSSADVEDLFGHGMFSASATQLLYDFGGGYGGLFFNKTGGGTFLEFSDEGVPAVSNPDGEELGVGVSDSGTSTNLSGSQLIGTASASPAPEPSTLALPGLGIGFLGLRRPQRN